MSTRQGTFGAGGNVEFNLVVTAEQTKQDLTTVIVQAEIAERILVSALSLVQKLSGDENLDAFISKIRQAIMVVNQLQIASTLLVATSPWLVALGVIGVAGMAVSMMDLTGSYV